MLCRTVDFDVSGVNPHAPSYEDMAPGKAMAERERYKIGKYSAHSQQGGRTFVPFVLDSYGCLAPGALQLFNDIRDESLSSAIGTPHPFRLSRASFLAELSRAWQADNAKIVVQWMKLQGRVHFCEGCPIYGNLYLTGVLIFHRSLHSKFIHFDEQRPMRSLRRECALYPRAKASGLRLTPHRLHRS